MSDTTEAPKKKGGKGKLILVLLVAVMLGGAGAAGGLYAAGAFAHKEADGPKEDPNKPQLVLAGEDPEAIAAKFGGGEKKEGEGSSHAEPVKGFALPAGGVDLPRPKNIANYHATYFQIPVPFTTNLVDTDSFAQISFAVATYYDMRVVDALKTHELALRSAILMELSQESEASLSTPEGKVQLQQKMTRLVNKVLKAKTGYSGVDNVYFTNFVIQ